MKLDQYALAKKICIEMGIEWNEDAEYATIGNVELKEFLLKEDIFDIEEKYSLIVYDENENIYEQDASNDYMIAA